MNKINANILRAVVVVVVLMPPIVNASWFYVKMYGSDATEWYVSGYVGQTFTAVFIVKSNGGSGYVSIRVDAPVSDISVSPDVVLSLIHI